MSGHRLFSLAATMSSFFTASAHAGPNGDRICPAAKVALTLDSTPSGTAEIAVVVGDDLSLQGLALVAQPGRPTLPVFHDNGSSATTLMGRFAPVAAEGYGIVAAEYRCLSGNPGKPSNPGLAADADAFWLMPETKLRRG